MLDVVCLKSVDAVQLVLLLFLAPPPQCDLTIIACWKPLAITLLLFFRLSSCPHSSLFILPSPSLSISVQALQCYECKIGLWNLCLTGKTTCESGEHCFSGVGKAGKERTHWMLPGEQALIHVLNHPTHIFISCYSDTHPVCISRICGHATGCRVTWLMSLTRPFLERRGYFKIKCLQNCKAK